MHARLDELLSLRDGDPVDAGVRVHVEACARCAAVRAGTAALRERLRELPPVAAARGDGWPDLRSRLSRARRASRRRAALASVAAAASLAALGLFAVLRLNDGTPLHTAVVARPPDGADVADRLAELRNRSQALEAVLAAMPERPAVERAATSVPIAALEAEVQWLDHRLALADSGAGMFADTGGGMQDAERLWRDRVEVMNTLVQLRYVEAQRAEF
jgi:hypothetical protein